MIRSFVALNIPSQVKEEIGDIIGELKKLSGDVKWVKPQNLHLTLKFLGEVEPVTLEKVYQKVEACAQKTQVFSFSLSGAGLFPNPKRPRVFWTGIKGGERELESLFRCLEGELEALGFQKEKRGFSPHLTIGRARTTQGMERLVERIKGIEYRSKRIEVSSLFVVKSQLTPQGPIYSPLREFKFKKGR